METRYDHKSVEPQIYDLWERSGYFNPDNLPIPKTSTLSPTPFSIVMPPPNVTGTLHIGHAVFMTLQDIMIRFQRMRGRKTLWLLGTDHAAIATQAKVENDLYKSEGKTRLDLGRDAFLKKVEVFARESHDTIIRQLKSWGASADWSREAYTLDEDRTRAVRTAFKKMYDDTIIYRGARMVNWDPKLQTTVSDDEIEWKEESANLYYLKYGPFTIATARPETKFGDKYVVMHPDDPRYRNYSNGQKIDLEWINGPITATVIKDTTIDMEFGTGVMTITPAHDATDFEIAERHNLEKPRVIDERGKLLPIAGEFADMQIAKARPLIVEKLRTKGLVDKIDDVYRHRIATNSRGGGLIEPQIKEQWFVDVNKPFTLKESHIPGIQPGSRTTLKDLMRYVVEKKLITIIPDHFEKVYFHWIDNLRDWCISRQIWFGHRIPAWYCKKDVITGKSEVGVQDLSGKRYPTQTSERHYTRFSTPCFVGINAPTRCPGCGGDDLVQDEDTLDTWFSSGLWTFSTLGWPTFAGTATAGKPGPENDLATYHPTDVLETGYDILFFWVARMILMTTYNLGDIPFRTVYLHGLVRDKDRQKMSKSKGNVIDPLGVAEIYGTDAVRMALVVGNTAGSDIIISEDKIRGYRNFATKIWNAARFVTANYDEQFSGIEPAYTKEDKRVFTELRATHKKITDDLESFRFHRAAETAYHYFWHTFADKIIEESKPRFRSDNLTDRATAFAVNLHILTTSLIFLHPFMPFITEEIYQKLPIPDKKLLMVESW